MLPTGRENILVSFSYTATLFREIRRCDPRKTSFLLAEEGQISVICELPEGACPAEFDARLTVDGSPELAKSNGEASSRARMKIEGAHGIEIDCRFRFGQQSPRFIEIKIKPDRACELDLTPRPGTKELPQVRSLAIYGSPRVGHLRIVNPAAPDCSRTLLRSSTHAR